MALPSFSFGAEGVEYGRAASYYATTAGNEVFPDDVDVQGNLSVQGSTTLRGTGINGTLSVAQPLTGGTRTAYFTNGASPPAEKSVAFFNDQSTGTLTAWRNNGNEGTLFFDGGVTGGQFVLNRPLVLPSGGGSSGNLTVGGDALVTGGIYGASLTTPPSFPIGFTSGVPLPLPAVFYNEVSVSDATVAIVNRDVVRLNIVVSTLNVGGINTVGAYIRNPNWTQTDVFMVSAITLPSYSVGISGAFARVPLTFNADGASPDGTVLITATCPTSEAGNFSGTIRCWVMRYGGAPA